MKTRIVHVSKPHDIRIDRTTKWGNPYIVGQHGDRDEVIEKYRRWIVEQPELMAEVWRLHGKTLGCHCAPKRCHGEVLSQFAGASWETMGGVYTTAAFRQQHLPDHGYWWVVSRQVVEESRGPVLRAASERNPDHHEILPDEDDPTILDAYHTYRLRDL